MSEKEYLTKEDLYKQIGKFVFENSRTLLGFYNPLNFFKLIKFFTDYIKLTTKLYNESNNCDLHEYTENGDEEKIIETSDILTEFFKYWAINRNKRKLLKKKNWAKVQLINDIKIAEEKAYTPVKNRLCYCLSSSMPYQLAGYNTRSMFMAQALKEVGFDIHVAVRPGFPWDKKDIKNNKNIPIFQEISGIKHYFKRLGKKERNPFKFYQNMIKKYEEYFLELKPEYVLAASNNDSAFCALIAAKSLGIPFYYEIRGFWEISLIAKIPEVEFEQRYSFERYMETKLAKLADKVFTLTTPMKNELVRLGVDENKIYLVPNCVDGEMYKPTPKDETLLKELNIPQNCPVIAYIGTIMVYEGLDDLVKACAILREKNIDFRLLVVGSANSESINIKYEKQIKNLIKDFHLENNVIFIERVSVNKTPRYYSISDIISIGRKPVLVSELVSPIKPYEAMAMEKTVIVSDVEALKEMVIDNETGLYFKKGDINSYAEVLEKAILNPELRERLGKQGRQWVIENRKWIYNAQTIKKVLEEN